MLNPQCLLCLVITLLIGVMRTTSINHENNQYNPLQEILCLKSTTLLSMKMKKRRRHISICTGFESSTCHIFIGPESDHCLLLSLTDWLTHSLTNWLPFSKLDWCDCGLWRCQLKTCWGCYCCWCWWWGSCRQQFVADLGAEVWS